MSQVRGLSRRRWLLAATALAVPAVRADGFDHNHAAWTALLRKHVVVLRGGQASQLRCAALGADRAALQADLSTLSSVSQTAFDAFDKPQRMAFLMLLATQPGLLPAHDTGFVAQDNAFYKPIRDAGLATGKLEAR